MPDGVSSPIFVQESILKLDRIAARQKRFYYFVIDGLLQMQKDSP
jgi:hypothetical protein